MFILAGGLAIIGRAGGIQLAAAKGMWLALIGGLILTLCGAAVLTIGGWLGGSLVFVHGTRVPPASANDPASEPSPTSTPAELANR